MKEIIREAVQRALQDAHIEDGTTAAFNMTVEDIVQEVCKVVSPATGEGQQQDERAMFEAWIETRIGYPFAGTFTNLMWDAWQARASLSSPSEQRGNAEERHEVEDQQPKSHRWDGEGERCLDCGDKDWMGDPVCTPRARLAAPSSPSVEIGTDFSEASVDTPELRSLLLAMGAKLDLSDFYAQVIAHIVAWHDQHTATLTAQAVKAAREEAAKVCERYAARIVDPFGASAARDCANEIRALRISHASETTPQPSAGQGEK